MSLAVSMKSWCDNFTNNCIDRKKIIKNVKKDSHNIVKRHNELRIKIGTETRDLLKEKFFENKKRVVTLIKKYVLDRSEASGTLSAMRGKPLKFHEELKHGH